MEDKRKIVDFLKKLLSRKLLVFVISTVLLLFGKIGQDIWLYVAVSYMGLQAAQSAIDGINFTKAKIAGTTTTDSSSASSTTTTVTSDGNGEA